MVGWAQHLGDSIAGDVAGFRIGNVDRTKRLGYGARTDLGAKRRWDEIGNLRDGTIHRGPHRASKYFAPDPRHLRVARLDRSRQLERK
jgi:hypothetical protein